MADTEKVLVQRVRFTGKHTGLDSIAVKGFGRVPQGATIEVTADEAERFTRPRKTRSGKDVADFSKVGGEFEVDKDEVMSRRLASRDKISDSDERLADALPDEVNTEPAHETNPDSGTVEEYSEVIHTAPESDDEPKKGATKK